MVPHLRIARPTCRLRDLADQYIEGLGFEVVGGFEEHDGFSGVMLGHPEAGWHLEFTHQLGTPPPKAPNEEHLLVFYLPDEDAFSAAVKRMKAADFVPVGPINPYWALNGRTFEDLDGYRVVLQNAAWPTP